MIKKYGAPLLLSIILCVFLTSCGIPKPPGEEEINRVLPDEIKTLIVENPFDLTNADLYEMETKTTIAKRQTNEKEDFTYCEVQLTSEYYQIVRYLKLNFNYYDEGGWLLDSYSEYQDPEWKLLKCPFNAEEVIYPVCEMFSQVDFKKTEEWLDDGAVDFYFTVEDPRENGTYSGTASVELFFDFDAVRWEYHINTNQVTFIWDIEGEWQYLENTSTAWGTDDKEISVKIGHFDQEAGTMEGTWYMRADFPILHVYSKNQILLADTEQVRIEAGETRVELWDNPNDTWGIHSVVRFYPDKVEASYSSHFGPVRLNRINHGNKAPSGLGISLDESEKQAIEKVIDQYFELVKGDSDISLEALTFSFPNILGDDLGEFLRDGLQTDIIEDFQYEMVVANQYFCDEMEARQMWEDAIEDEFGEKGFIPESYAEIQLRVDLKTSEKLTEEKAKYYTDSGYVPIILVKNNGKWGLFYVDDFFPEIQDMFFEL